jgi:predicted lipoprotein with Yx(FWY)xxD motif
MKSRYSIVALIAGLLVTAGAWAQDAKMKGGVLVNSAGMTLYVFDKDVWGKSACNGPCAAIWPPMIVGTSKAVASGDWQIITRDDGNKQWAYKGRPLYTWSKDTKPGDMTGDGFNGAWHVVKG